MTDTSEIVCYPAPTHINRQRKSKRRCVGIHPYPAFFSSPVEILPGVQHHLILDFLEKDASLDVETVWGGGGREIVSITEAASHFHFRLLDEPARLRSSVTSGQIPVIFYS